MHLVPFEEISLGVQVSLEHANFQVGELHKLAQCFGVVEIVVGGGEDATRDFRLTQGKKQLNDGLDAAFGYERDGKVESLAFG